MIRRLYTCSGSGADPYRNLALERYLTETVPEDACILYLWQNQNTVVIGRNQNAWKECRTGLLEQEGGVLARRLSGGGAVFHDLGNLNFTFSVTEENYDLPRQQQVILTACRLLGLRAELSGRNDLLAEGRKFSGNSFYSHGGRSFHNGTLLIDADMAKMSLYLAPSKLKLEAKGVNSVRSRVVNLCELAPGITVGAMVEAMTAAFCSVYCQRVQTLADGSFDRGGIEERRDRFASYEWIYGRNADFPLCLEERFAWGELTLRLDVRQGVCTEAAVYTDAMDTGFARPLEVALCGSRLDTQALCRRVQGVKECAPYAADICRMLREQNI